MKKKYIYKFELNRYGWYIFGPRICEFLLANESRTACIGR